MEAMKGHGRHRTVPCPAGASEFKQLYTIAFNGYHFFSFILKKTLLEIYNLQMTKLFFNYTQRQKHERAESDAPLPRRHY